MHKKIADFLAKNRPKGARSKVWPHRDDVLELRNSGASLQQICDYLNEQGTHVSKQYLSVYIQQINKQTKALEKPVQLQPTEKEQNGVKDGATVPPKQEEKALKMPYKKFDMSY